MKQTQALEGQHPWLFAKNDTALLSTTLTPTRISLGITSLTLLFHSALVVQFPLLSQTSIPTLLRHRAPFSTTTVFCSSRLRNGYSGSQRIFILLSSADRSAMFRTSSEPHTVYTLCTENAHHQPPVTLRKGSKPNIHASYTRRSRDYDGDVDASKHLSHHLPNVGQPPFHQNILLRRHPRTHNPKLRASTLVKDTPTEHAHDWEHLPFTLSDSPLRTCRDFTGKCIGEGGGLVRGD
ncbi:hypothetical protein V8E53_004912 [Lactarius tabidus]